MAVACCENFFHRITRRKFIDWSTISETKLSRCLTVYDLTALGVGCTLGAGIYVVAGQVAKDTAGPAVVVSFLIAAAASILSGLCYAEFGARVPKTGSAYVYSYVTVGELWAFVIGWNLILEYVIGTASVARAWSAYFDSLINNTISNFFLEHTPMHISGISPYPDFFALGVTLLLTVLLVVGVKESTRFNNLFTCVNLLVVAYVVICGLFKADINNWNLPENTVPNATVQGHGGFAPFGFSGIMSGAATCFYAFVGFDVIATTAEEVENPQRSVPISIIASLVICFLAYFGISATITLMCPYYLLNGNATLPFVFERVGWGVAKYIIAVGAICGLSTSLLGGMFPMPRVIYAMASDGILYRFLSNVNDRFKTPVIATILSGVVSGLMAMIFELEQLVQMMAIGTLLAYTLVAICVLLLRFCPLTEGECFKIDHKVYGFGHMLRCLFVPEYPHPTRITSLIIKVSVAMLSLLSLLIAVILIFARDYLLALSWWVITILVLLVICYIAVLIVIWRQPQNRDIITFLVPGLPFLPALSIFVNIYLMLKLNPLTWIRFAVWLVIGFVIYFTYGMFHSNEEARKSEQLHPIVSGNVEISANTTIVPQTLETQPPSVPYEFPVNFPAGDISATQRPYPSSYSEVSGLLKKKD